MKEEIATPRTREEWRRLQRLPDGQYSSEVTYGDLAHGMFEFAQKIERELAEMTKQRDTLVDAMSVMWPFIEEDDTPACNTPSFNAAIAKYKKALALLKSDE